MAFTAKRCGTYRREVWRCNSKFKGEARCETPALDTEVIQQMFLKAYNQLMGSREQVIQACEVMRTVVADFTELDAEIEALNEEIQVVAGLVSQCIKENATSQQSQEEYNKKYNRLVRHYEKAVEWLKRATAEKESRTDRDRDIRIFIAEIEKQPLVLETWDERLWISLLDSATVHADGRITFQFKTEQTSRLGLNKPRLFAVDLFINMWYTYLIQRVHLVFQGQLLYNCNADSSLVPSCH